ncbi:MAG: type III-B CRISPR module RAMP protein Cmr4 [Firmicutes bacterium]|jgi:CRISPR-associated protein Cmr4|nr:type III-B CRISPR module RAMP protein Cmr4 [Bacillota bacterium]
MKQEKGTLFLYAQSFLHPGAGTSTEVIDVPIQREAHTKYPIIPASSLKGSLRDLAERKIADQSLVADVFGVVRDKEAFAGALTVGDGKILALPVRSLTRTFFWVSSPLVLSRVKRDVKASGLRADWGVIPEIEQGQGLVPTECNIEGDLYLEEMNLSIKPNKEVSAMAQFIASQLDPAIIGEAYAHKLQNDLVVVSDDDFSYFVRFATHVTARIQLTSAKTTGTYETADGVKEQGNLWYEEALPPETIFYAQVGADNPRGNSLSNSQEVLQILTDTILADRFIQLGGNETLGQGWCAAFFARGVGA